MYLNRLKSMVPVMLLLSIAMSVRGQTDCELKKEKDDLRVYTCSADDSKLKILKAELILNNTSFKELLDFVEDIKNYTNWQYNTIEAATLEERDTSLVYRTVIDAPWPLSRREMIMELSSRFDSAKQQLLIDTRHVSYEYPLNDNLVRVPFAVGTWLISSQKNSLKVEYTLQIDPGGSVPAWLVNMAMADGPYTSFLKLKELVTQKRQ
jgi:hypothetical protein